MLHSPDFAVADADALARRLVASIGLPEPDPAWTQDFPGHGYRAIFARVHRSRSYAPTRLEMIAYSPIPEPVDSSIPRGYIKDYMRIQGDRPLKTHATVFTTSDIEGLIDRVRRRGLRHRVDPISSELPHLRLWLGVTDDAPADYQADDDAGLFFEAIPTQGLLLRIAPTDPAPPPPEPLLPGQMSRIVAREHLVADIDATLRTLSRNLDFGTAGPVAMDRVDGCRRVVLAVTMQHGAHLELVQPMDPDSEAGRYFSRWGPGPYYTRIAVAGVPEKAEDLRARGTAFSQPAGERPRLHVDVDGALIEFIDVA